MKSKFEEWFQLQPFYLNLRFIHGERLFIFDAQDGYVVQAVQIAWATWQEQQKQIATLDKLVKIYRVLAQDNLPRCSESIIQNLLDLEYVLKGSEPQVQEVQACDHTMAEKTQFGDLHRTFECIFCDHKTIEAWVTNE
ncbi:hypothetical protein ACX1NX_11450 [Acinetobacter sp. ANC 5383]